MAENRWMNDHSFHIKGSRLVPFHLFNMIHRLSLVIRLSTVKDVGVPSTFTFNHLLTLADIRNVNMTNDSKKINQSMSTTVNR